MSGLPDAERRFVASVEVSGFASRDIARSLGQLHGWLAQLERALDGCRLALAGLREGGALHARAQAVNDGLQAGRQAWMRQEARLAAAEDLADALDDKVVVLVFGKFNAGKSAFCNFLAERFAAHGKPVGYFHLDGGRLVATAECFAEGATETTARLQGVCLGDRLVLLDTPGLHSVTPENAALTRRFIDSADAVLWLTSSTSPGQVQELDELARELHRHKPLLPVLTRSDVYEEDEVDGEIRKVLRNKTAANRAQQEADVAARTREKLASLELDPALLRPPVSVSAYMARLQGKLPEALDAAGFGHLYAALQAILAPALAYKRRKPAEIRLHHLEEAVLGDLQDTLRPSLAALRDGVEAACEQLDHQQARLVATSWRSLAPELLAALEDHASAREAAAVSRTISAALAQVFARERRQVLGDYALEDEVVAAPVEPGEGVGYDAVTLEGEVIDIDYARLHAALKEALATRLATLADDAADQCRASLQALLEGMERLQAVLAASETDLARIKRELRA